MEDKAQQEILFKLSMYEQQMNNIGQQLQAIEKAIVDVSSINFGLDELKGKTGEEILASIGKGIFIKAKLVSEELIVDIGGKNLVEKSIPETQKIIKEQLKKLEEIKRELEGNLEEMNNQIQNIILEHQKKQGK
ncbi:MAG TPA: prefoldin subunit alpha [Candidatus Nanoarchaeia archaeon]|nr:prefoldin subunit alpha [Candidatus Nanoarchaeia archaeon]